MSPPERWRILAVAIDERAMGPCMSLLGERGFRVVACTSAYGAMAEVMRDPPQTLLCNLDRLGTGAAEFIEAVRRERTAIHLIVAFSPENRFLAMEALQHGADAYLLNPFHATELCAMVERARDRAALQEVAAPEPEPAAAPVVERAQEKEPVPEKERAPEQGRPREEEPASAQPETIAGSVEPGTPRQAGDALSRIAVGLAHEINNPLTMLSGWLQRFAGDQQRPESERRTFESMKEEADRIATVVRELSAFATERGPGRARLDLNVLVTDALDLLDEMVQSKRVRISTRLDESLPDLEGDEQQLRHVCDHLLTYALHGVGPDRVLEVSTARGPGGDVQARFRIPGKVVSPHQLDKLFDPFGIASGRDDGSGTGLCVCHGIVSRHGGSLNVESDEHEGITITISFPPSRNGAR